MTQVSTQNGIPAEPVFNASDIDWGAIEQSEVLEPMRLLGLQRLSALTPRETEVLHELTAGYPNKAIGLRLKISPKTVEKHRASIMRKLDVTNVPDLMRLWLQAHPHELSLKKE